MKYKVENKRKIWYRLLLMTLISVSFCACQEETPDYLRAGELFPRSDKSVVFEGESITFTDYSTRVISRTWSFIGGNPATSIDQQVDVSYAVAGIYNATLQVTYEDGTTASELLEIVVNAEYVPLVSLEGPRYVFYSEDQDLAQDHPEFGLGTSGAVKVSFVGNAFEGEQAMNLAYDSSIDKTFIMFMTDKVGQVDLTQYINGYLNLALKSTSPDPLLVRIEGGGANSYAEVKPGDYGFERDGEWHFISIPMADVLSQIDNEAGQLALLGSFEQFRLRNNSSETSDKDAFDFTADFIFFSVNLPVLN